MTTTAPWPLPCSPQAVKCTRCGVTVPIASLARPDRCLQADCPLNAGSFAFLGQPRACCDGEQAQPEEQS